MIISYTLYKIRESGKLKKISQSKFDMLFKILVFAEISTYTILFIVRFFQIAPNHDPRSINSIRSIYSKEDIKDILLWIVEDNLLEYVDKEKILNWMGKHQSHSDEVTRLIKDATKIIQDFDIYK